LEQIEEIRENTINEACEITQTNQAQFLDKLAMNGSDNDDEIVTLISEKMQNFDKKIEMERISIQKRFDRLTKELNIGSIVNEVKLKLNISVYDRFKEVCESKIKNVDKKSRINEKTLTQLESFVENLALAISSMEKRSNDVAINPAATQKQFNPMWLSCGNKKGK